jgi:hypothetical protein
MSYNELDRMSNEELQEHYSEYYKPILITEDQIAAMMVRLENIESTLNKLLSAFSSHTTTES